MSFLSFITKPFKWIIGKFRKKEIPEDDLNLPDSQPEQDYEQPQENQYEQPQETLQSNESNKHELIISKLDTINAKLDALNERLKGRGGEEW